MSSSVSFVARPPRPAARRTGSIPLHPRTVCTARLSTFVPPRARAAADSKMFIDRPVCTTQLKIQFFRPTDIFVYRPFSRWSFAFSVWRQTVETTNVTAINRNRAKRVNKRVIKSERINVFFKITRRRRNRFGDGKLKRKKCRICFGQNTRRQSERGEVTAVLLRQKK